MTIGEKLRKIRMDLNLTQKQFAQKIGVSQCAITYWENEKRKPRLEQLEKISDKLNISLFELLGENTTQHFSSTFLEDHPAIDQELVNVINQFEPLKNIDISKISTEKRAELYNTLLAGICYENEKELLIFPSISLKTNRIDILLDNFKKLNDLGKTEALKRIGELTEIKKYIE